MLVSLESLETARGELITYWWYEQATHLAITTIRTTTSPRHALFLLAVNVVLVRVELPYYDAGVTLDQIPCGSPGARA